MRGSLFARVPTAAVDWAEFGRRLPLPGLKKKDFYVAPPLPKGKEKKGEAWSLKISSTSKGIMARKEKLGLGPSPRKFKVAIRVGGKGVRH